MSWVIGLTSLILFFIASFIIYFFTRKLRDSASHEVAQVQFLSLQQRIDHLQEQLRLSLDGNTQLFQSQLAHLNTQIGERLGESLKFSQDSGKSVNERLDRTGKYFAEMEGKLGKLSEAYDKIYLVGKDIRSLHDILQSPKARGNLGELFLERLLSEMLPQAAYRMQYTFKNNEKVDAVIFIEDHLIPIDSKFPVEPFKRLMNAAEEAAKKLLKKQFLADVKKHVDAIAKKYILPQEGTFDFSLMYIPSENIFYEMIIRDDEVDQVESLQNYALKKKVIPVSPNSLYAYLAALMYALRGHQMRENITEVIGQIRQLSVEFGKFREDFTRMGHHLNNLTGAYEASEKRLTRYGERMDKIHAGEEDATLPEQNLKLIQ